MVLGATSKTMGAIAGTASLPVFRRYIDSRFSVPAGIPYISDQSWSRILTLGVGGVVAFYRFLMNRSTRDIPLVGNLLAEDFLEMYAITALTNVAVDMGTQRFPMVTARVAAPALAQISTPQIVARPAPSIPLSVF